MNSKKIKEIRFKLGLTQEEFAHKIGVSVSTVARWETNRKSPSPLAERAIIAFALAEGIEVR